MYEYVLYIRSTKESGSQKKRSKEKRDAHYHSKQQEVLRSVHLLLHFKTWFVRLRVEIGNMNATLNEGSCRHRV